MPRQERNPYLQRHRSHRERKAMFAHMKHHVTLAVPTPKPSQHMVRGVVINAPKDLRRFKTGELHNPNDDEAIDTAYELAEEEERDAHQKLMENIQAQNELMDELHEQGIRLSDSDEMQTLESEQRILREELKRAEANSDRLRMKDYEED